MSETRWRNWRLGAWSLGAAGVGLGIYIGVAAIFGLLGFPLDDAWIHQTYARSLAVHGEWAYWPGEISSGSTAPLWTILLIPGQWLQGGMLIWTFFLGWLGLGGSAWLAQITYQNLLKPAEVKIPVMALILTLEWHLVWAAGSGMETILYVLLILAVFAVLTRRTPIFWLAGSLAGLTAWVRPDGLTLLGPVVLVAFLGADRWKKGGRGIVQGLAGFLVPFLPYLLFNYLLAGTIWPNTFYAKQAEYFSMTGENFLVRFLRLGFQPLVGVGILLLPGWFWGLYRGWKMRNWAAISLGLFWLGTTVLYAWRLPVIYQHARYLIPSMAAFFVLGFYGMSDLWLIFMDSRLTRLMRFAWRLAVTVTLLLFFFIGSFQYTNDIGIINTEMVAAGKWIAQNTGEDALIAAHDIGALGYFGGRRLVDLAGLISPEVIPFIRDEQKLANFLEEQGADYLVTFPGWYETLEEGKQEVWRSEGEYSIQQGGENMRIYRWIVP